MREFSVGIVGAGTIASQVHLPVLASMSAVRVAWVTDSDPTRAVSVAHAYRVPSATLTSDPAALPECDAVLLATPVGVRTGYYEAFAKKGAAVLAEKPFSTSSAEHARLMRLFPSHRIGCGYMRRMYRTVGFLRQVIAEGWLGPLRRLRLAEGARTTKTGADHSHYDDVTAAGGGVLISLGCHGIDLALYLTDARDYRVLHRDLVMDGLIDRKVTAKIELFGIRGDTYEFDFCNSWIDAQENVIQLEFDGAILSSGLQPWSSVTLCGRGKGAGTAREIDLGAGPHTWNQAFFREWEEFLGGLAESRPSAIAASTSLLTAALIDELYGRVGVKA